MNFRAVCVDDETIALDSIKKEIEKLPEISSAAYFDSPLKALDWLQNNEVDVAFLDISMRVMDGLTQAKKLKEIHPRCAVVFVTGHTEYAVQAIRMHASGYLMKPVTVEDIRTELEYIQNPQPAPKPAKHVRIQCFGNFEVFVDDQPLKFERSKTKELLAYLVDRKGAVVNTGELCAVLWEDKQDTLAMRSNLRNLLTDLSRCLKQADAEGILFKSRNSFAIAIDKVDCDYYGFLRKDARTINTYTGEYMTQYSWAEMTLSSLKQ